VRPHQHGEEERVLRPEVQVDGALADAGVAGDVLDRHALVAPPDQELGRAVEHSLDPRFRRHHALSLNVVTGFVHLVIRSPYGPSPGAATRTTVGRMGDYEHLLVKHDGPTVRITMNRPERRNTLT